MYGTIDKRPETEGNDEQLAQAAHQTSLSGMDNSLSQCRIDMEAESRRRKKIYSHCHIQSANDGDEPNNRRNVDKSARRRLVFASVICLIFMIAEVVGGVLSNSLAIATDAAHLLTDFASFMISLFAIWLSSRPASRKMSFGWYRAEVIGALVSVLMIWLVTGLLVYMAVERIRTGNIEIDSFVMVVTASAGLLVNIIMAVALNVDGHGHGHFHGHGHSHGHHDHSHEINQHSHLDHVYDNPEFEDDELESDLEQQQKQDQHYHSSVTIDCSMKQALTGAEGGSPSNGTQLHLADKKRPTERRAKRACRSGGGNETANGRGRNNINVRAAFIHVIGDFLQSLGVLIAALVIHFEPTYAIVDPICTFIFSFIVLVTTINIIRDATNVLMEGIPDGINFIEVREKLQSLPSVIRVHNLRIWSLSLDKIAISTHLVIDTSKTTSALALKHAIDTLKSSFNFFEITIQIEEYRDDMKDCEHCQDDEVVMDNVAVDGAASARSSSKSN